MKIYKTYKLQLTAAKKVIRNLGDDYTNMSEQEILARFEWWNTEEIRICTCPCKQTFTCLRKLSYRYIAGHQSRGKKWSKDSRARSSEIHKALFDPSTEKGLGLRQQVGLNHKGSLCSFWKGGITPLVAAIRAMYGTKKWNIEVFKRDRYTCQDCGYKGHNLEAHHKKAFIHIFQEFLKTYSQFSPIEDKETLMRLAESYEPFWNLKNGQTLCWECHSLTDTYGSKVHRNLTA